MVDNFALLVSHGLVFIAMWRLLFRPDLDVEVRDPPEMNDGPPAQTDARDA